MRCARRGLRRAAPLLALVALPLLGGGGGQRDLRAYRVVAARSDVYVETHKSGVLSFLGHEHAIVPTEWSTELCLADPVPVGAHGSIRIRTGSLVIDSDTARGLAGLGSGPGAADRSEIQGKMLDSAHLDAKRYPEVLIVLSAVGPEREGEVDVRGTLALHGVTRDVAFPLQVLRADEGGLRISGDLRIRQRDFGIEPESVHGVVKVSNDVDLHFSVEAVPTVEPCGPDPPPARYDDMS
jgi:hypothetical protein